MPALFLDGALLDPASARLGVFDAGLQHGVGLFETMTAVRRHQDPDQAFDIIGLADHVERLIHSARALGLSDDLRAQALADACLQTARRSGEPRVRLRLTVTGGDLNLLQASGLSNHTPTVLIAAQPATNYPDALYERGVLAVVADAKANPLDPTAGHKSLNYWWRLRELQRAAAKGAGEALVFQVSNHLAGGCVSNAILIKDDRLYTPIARGEEPPAGLPSPVLPGVTRAMVIGWAEDRGLDVVRQMLTIDDLLHADELVMTNSGFGVLPVTRLESRPIGPGRVGPIAQDLIARWRERLGD